MPAKNARAKAIPTRRRKYRRPPIEEALCDIQFEPSEPLDATSLLLSLHAALKAEYPGPTRTQTVQSVTLSGQNTNIHEQLARIQVLSADGTRLIGVGQNALSINVLKPYPGWDEDFRARIERAFAALQKAASPKHATRIGLRYINRISVPGSQAKASDYFTNVDPDEHVPDAALGPFLKRLEYLTSSGHKIVVTQGTIVARATATTDFLLDIDAICDRAPILLDQVLQVATDLHEREGAVFEALITDRSRSLFNAD